MIEGSEKQVVVVTGASSGFGEMTAYALADAGHTVYASMRGISGHCKTDGHLGRNFHKGTIGDQINAVVSAAEPHPTSIGQAGGLSRVGLDRRTIVPADLISRNDPRAADANDVG